MKLILLGAPGCGKGTQSPKLVDRYNICHLSTGDMLRAAVAAGTPAGLKAKGAMDAGALVTDDIVFGVLKEGMAANPQCKNGYIIDGLPRSLEQARKMEAEGLTCDKAVSFDVPDDVIIERTSGRWIHRASGRTYHSKFAPPKVAGIDDVSGEPLMQRNDDKAEVVKKRLVLFHEQIGPIKDLYKAKGQLINIDGNRKAAEITANLFAMLDPVAKKH